MDEEEAIKILTGELAKDLGISIVRDEWYKKELIKKFNYFNQFSNPMMVDYKHYDCIPLKDKHEAVSSGGHFIHTPHYIKTQIVHTTLSGLIKNIESCNGANYFFIDTPLHNESSNSLNNLHFFVTPYSIIGEKEINHLRKSFYKDVQPQIQGAMDVLNIENYADVYSLYTNNISLNLTGTAVKDFLDSELHLDYFNDWGNKNIIVIDIESVGNLNRLNLEFENIGLKSQLDTTKYREEKAIKAYPKRINKKNIKEVVNEMEQKSFLFAQEDTRKEMLKNFWDFVFTIPYNHQNIQSNQAILKSHAGEIDYISILGNEYNKGRHFPEYFNCLDDLQQQRVARCLKNTPERNIANDSFLWSKGFKEISRDYMDIYKKDADEFIEYFKSKKPDDKKTILKDIITCDYTNKAAANWLDENETELLREVSMDG